MTPTNDEISYGAEWASDAENMEYWQTITVDPKGRVTPPENQMSPGLFEAYCEISDAIRIFEHNISAETDYLIGCFRRWLHLTEQIHSATLDESSQSK
jgi:hypothetical protein